MGCRSLREAMINPNTGYKKRQEMAVSIFDRLVSKETGEQERKILHPTPYRKMFPELEATGKEAKARYPEDSKVVEDFVWALKEGCRARYKLALDSDLQPMKAEPRFFLSNDRMCAYACVLPPEYGGEGLTLEAFMDDLHYEGITYGILQEEVEREFGKGYLHIFPVARGKAPLAGEDGKVTELFRPRQSVGLEVQVGGEVDFSQEVQIQPIRKGAVICLIRPSKPGTDGMDVTGEPLPSPAVASIFIPQGENTVIGRGGQALTARVDGILYEENHTFCIHEQKIIDGDLDQFQGTLQIMGNLYIGGSVDGGVEIEASGDIVINGKLGQAKVTSMAGTIRVQQGVYGTEGKTVLNAARQIQAPVIEWAEMDAGTSVIAETILNSTIRCGGTVFAMTGRGIIASCAIQAGGSVLCRRVGNLAGGHSRFSVGYPPHIPEAWNRSKAELAEVQATIEKLWDPIVELRKKGSRISEGEETVLGQLVEQRNLYLEKKEILTAELKTLNKALDKKSKGRIRCDKLHPSLDVQIGRLTEAITTEEEGCNLHVEEKRILLK